MVEFVANMQLGSGAARFKQDFCDCVSHKYLKVNVVDSRIWEGGERKVNI